jgi:hypothetical protein
MTLKIKRSIETSISAIYIPSTRAAEEDIQAAIREVAENPIVTALLDATRGWMVVVNGERQIIAANQAILSDLGSLDTDSLAALRLGEAIECSRSTDG